jgi:preprotein translocase subunit SecF
MGSKSSSSKEVNMFSIGLLIGLVVGISATIIYIAVFLFTADKAREIAAEEDK